MLMRLKGIKRVTVKRAGKVYVYYRHRATGTRLKADPGTAAFAVEVAALDARAKAKSEPTPGTWGELVAKYKASPEWKEQIGARTRKDYNRVFTYLEPLNDDSLSAFTTREIYSIRDAAFEKHKRRFSTYVVQVIRLVFTWALKREYVASNPAKEVDTLRRPKHLPRANRAWADAERDVVLSEAPPHLLAMIALGMFAGLSEGDACHVPKTCYDGKRIDADRAKTGAPIWIPAHYRLREALTAGERARQARLKSRKVVAIDPPNLVVNSRGQPWTESGFRASFFKFLGKLERAGKVARGLTYHGLRHTVGKLVIDAGGDTKDVQAVLAHLSPRSSEHYSQEADMQRRATKTVKRMERIERKRMDKQADNSRELSADKSAKLLKLNGAQGQN